MDTASLELFVETAQRLSFAAVAEQRGISPSSVSRNIGQLEQRLGVRLFQRTTRTMALTDAGAAYLSRVRGVLEELDAAEEAARSGNTAPRGRLRLTASVAFGERVVVPLMPAFRTAYPDIDLELLFTDADLDLVGEAIDLAIRLGQRRGGNAIATRLFRTRYRVVASPAYIDGAAAIVSPRDLERHPCTVFAMPAFRSTWRFRARSGEGPAQSVAIRSGTTVSSALSLRSLVLGGAGPALLADWLIGDDIVSGRLVDVLPGYVATATDFDTAAWLTYPSRAFLPQKVRVMIDYLKRHLGDA